MSRKIIYSAIKTPDGTILESLYRHDFKTYLDKNGKEYMIDGGTDYIRSSANGDEEFITIYSDASHEIVRQYAYRLGFGKLGSPDYGKFRKTLIKDMTNEHLQASLDYKNVTKGGTHWRMLLAEKLYRLEHEITISEL